VREQAQRLGVAHRLDVVTWDRAQAFCYGFMHPRICISTGLLALLGPTEVEAVLRHERHHLQRRDPLRVLGWTILCGACGWLTDRAAQADLLRELAADRAVIQEQGRAPLASALLTLLTQPRDAYLHGLAVSGVSVTDARIDQLLAPGQQTGPTHIPLLGRWMLGLFALLGYVVVCSVVMAFVP
jgi:Zn-dependent protease with chaperone function